MSATAIRSGTPTTTKAMLGEQPIGNRPILISSESRGWTIPEAIVKCLGQSVLQKYYSLTSNSWTARDPKRIGNYISEKFGLQSIYDDFDLTECPSRSNEAAFDKFMTEYEVDIWRRLYRKVDGSLILITAIREDERLFVSADLAARIDRIDIWRNCLFARTDVFRDVLVFDAFSFGIIDTIGMETERQSTSNGGGRPTTYDWNSALDEFLINFIKEAEFESAAHLIREIQKAFKASGQGEPEESYVRKELNRRFPKLYERAKPQKP